MERQYQCLRCGRDSRTHECEQIAHAKMVDLQRALDAEREKVKGLEEQLRLANCDQANTEADLNDVTAQLATLQAHHDKFFDLQCPKAPPSCLMCGQVEEFAIKHLVLGSVGICKACVSVRETLQAQLRQVREALQGILEKWCSPCWNRRHDDI